MSSKIRRLIFLTVVFITLFSVSCNQNRSTEIELSFAKIHKEYIEDLRLEYWNIEVEKLGNNYEIKGCTSSEDAYSKLQAFSSQNKLEFKVTLLPEEEFKKNHLGIVTLSVCNIRKDPKHSAELVSQALMGTPVKIYKKQFGWYLIQTPDRYFGWVDSGGISPKTHAEIMEWKKLKKVIYNQQFGFVYSELNNKSEICSDLVLADLLSVVGEENDYYKIILPGGRNGFVKTEECISLDIWKKKELSIENVLSTALKFNGTPYLWGGTSSKMVDCSGFTKTVFYLNGIILQRDASQQTLFGELVNTQNNYDNLQTGDLVFFGQNANNIKTEKVTHVGLYIGNSEFIHASGKVHINSLEKSSHNYTKYYETVFVRARRIKKNVDGIGIEWIYDNDFYKEILPE